MWLLGWPLCARRVPRPGIRGRADGAAAGLCRQDHQAGDRSGAVDAGIQRVSDIRRPRHSVFRFRFRGNRSLCPQPRLPMRGDEVVRLPQGNRRLVRARRHIHPGRSCRARAGRSAGSGTGATWTSPSKSKTLAPLSLRVALRSKFNAYGVVAKVCVSRSPRLELVPGDVMVPDVSDPINVPDAVVVTALVAS